jgi:ubiquinone/menaquinone biosynthesis C-methylase UbiE
MIDPRTKAATRSSQDSFYARYGGSAPENYQRYFVPVIGAPLAADLVEVAALRPGERVLDVACGTGTVARLAAEQVGPTGSVTGIDLNPGMLAVARSVTPPEMAIEWHQTSAESIPLPDEVFDVVLCQLGLQFIQNRLAALQEMRRLLVSSGRLIINVVGPRPELFTIMADALARHVNPQASAFVNQVFSLHDAGELQDLIVRAGFREQAVRSEIRTLRLPAPEEFLWQYLHSTPLIDPVAQAKDENRAALERDVVTTWQDFVENGALTLRVRVLVATARR